MKAYYTWEKNSKGFVGTIFDEGGKKIATTEPKRSRFSLDREIDFFRRQNGYDRIRVGRL